MVDGPIGPVIVSPQLADMARSIMAEILTPQNLQKLAKNQQNIALETGKDAIELGWKLTATLPIMLAKLILGVMEGGEAEFDELAKVAVDGLFGDGGIRHGRSKGYTSTVSAKILDALTNGAKSVEPNEDAARHFLDVATHLEIEGWMIDWISEMVSAAGGVVGVGQIHEFGKLKDGIAKAMGLGRLSRRVFGPYVDTFITHPTRQALNKKYTPHGLTPPQAVKHYFRGFTTYDEMHEVLIREGLNERAIEALQYDTRKYFPSADVDLLVRSGHWTRDQGFQHLRESGLEFDQAERELLIEDLKSLRRFQERSTDVVVDAYANGSIDEAQMDRELAGAVVDPQTRDRLRFLARKRRELNPKHLTLAQAEQAVELHVWSVTDYRDYLDRQGYDRESAITLELMLHAKMNKLEDAQRQRAQAAADRAATKAAREQEQRAKRDALAAEHANFSGSVAQAERLVIRGQMTSGRYRRILLDNGFTSEDASLFASLAQTDATAYATQQEQRSQAIARAGRQEIAVATLERAVKRGRLSVDDYRRQLLERNFTDDQAQLLVDVLVAELADQAAAEQQRAAAAARLAIKHLSLGQVETAVRTGVQSMNDYRAFLSREGFSSADMATLVALLQSKMDADAAAEERRARIAAELEASKLSLAQEEAAVKEGLKSENDYAAFLLSHGYTADDVDTLSTLLALKLGLLS